MGKVVGGEVVTLDEYLRVENAYLSCLRRLAERTGVTSLVVRSLEIRADHPPFDLESGMELSLDLAIEVCREMLREGGVWCRLHRAPDFYVHIGYDYYMYVGTSAASPDEADRCAADGLFLEEDWPSPYLDIEGEDSEFTVES
ncbi:hypothetical protein ACFFSW_01975 [Saccharothrix longispora]|uniref:Small subunit ribosomal protein S1 n=1 Tax=Saccharothrix longispora TaxID=33920 RepID=A0ABU1PVT2_9PSEU|nr:hypothetical protein [Saccharothrix longispora]MDR6594752.1 small subunit ribosomal protein S1 [Saccharothrix longispora]